MQSKQSAAGLFGINHEESADFERLVYFKVILVLLYTYRTGGEARVAILINTSDKYDIKLTAGRNALGHTAIVSCARINLIV